MMAICNRTSVGIIGFVLLGVVIVGAFGTSSAQQPFAPVDPPELVPDFKNDPLFQEIQRIVLEGGKSTQRNAIPTLPSKGLGGSSSLPTEFKIDMISNDRWHAIESILAAARILENEESECIRRSDLEGASKTHTAIKNLRAQAYELLHGL
jgi:hypothetical protein